MLSINTKIKLNNGYEMPQFGLGTYLSESTGSTQKVIVHALTKAKYIHLDTAELYGNEKEIGEGLKMSGVPRESVFITSKLWSMEGGAKSTRRAFKNSLADLGLAYIDQYLLHAPQGGRVLECYDALLEFVKDGSLKSLGVSNFGVHHLKALKQAGRPLPATNQIELHPWCTNQPIVDWCRANNVAIVAYCPLARMAYKNDPVLVDICKKHGKEPAQVMIRWSLQKGYVCIPKSADTGRIDSNANVFDFALDDTDMSRLGELGSVKKNVDWDPTVWRFDQFGPLN